jgi:hypothetical protein
MLRLRRCAALFGIGFLSLAGCVSDDHLPTNSPATSISSVPTRHLKTFDDEFADIAAAAPGFAGMYFRDGQLIVRTTRATPDHLVLSAIQHVNAGVRFDGVAAAVAADKVALEPAEFDFLTLRTWAAIMVPALSESKVQLFDIDESLDRIRIGVLDRADGDAIAGVLRSLGVPSHAVVVQVTGQVKFQTDLDDYLRPFPGGMRVNNCTVGVNVDASEDGEGFITAAHCTDEWGGDGDFTSFYQPSYPDYVGYEWVDGDLGEYRSDTNCPSPYLCRYSDAAFISFDDANDAYHGAIARTTGLGSTTISSSTPRFLLNEPPTGSLLVGTDINIMGSAGGWHAGEVTATCVWVPGPPDNTRLLCQWEADYGSSNGDSWAPVFKWDGSGTYVDLVGIHSAEVGGDRLFSRWLYVDFELAWKLAGFNVAY